MGFLKSNDRIERCERRSKFDLGSGLGESKYTNETFVFRSVERCFGGFLTVSGLGVSMAIRHPEFGSRTLYGFDSFDPLVLCSPLGRTLQQRMRRRRSDLLLPQEPLSLP